MQMCILFMVIMARLDVLEGEVEHLTYFATNTNDDKDCDMENHRHRVEFADAAQVQEDRLAAVRCGVCTFLQPRVTVLARCVARLMADEVTLWRTSYSDYVGPAIDTPADIEMDEAPSILADCFEG